MARRDSFVDTPRRRCPSSPPAPRRSSRWWRSRPSDVTVAGRQGGRQRGRGGHRVLRDRRRARPGSSATAARSPRSGPGGFFGDLALLDRAPRNASVIADTELELAKLGQREFDALLDAPRLLEEAARRPRAPPARTGRPTASSPLEPVTLFRAVVSFRRALCRSRTTSSSSSACSSRSARSPRASPRGSPSGTTTRAITREPFGNIPDPIYWAFYVTAAIMLFVCAWLVSQRVRNYERGAPDDRRTNKRNVHRRMKDFRAGVWMQTLLRDPAAGPHALVHLLRLPRGCSSPPSSSRSTTSSPTT